MLGLSYLASMSSIQVFCYVFNLVDAALLQDNHTQYVKCQAEDRNRIQISILRKIKVSSYGLILFADVTQDTHALLYNANAIDETWEWVNIKEVRFKTFSRFNSLNS